MKRTKEERLRILDQKLHKLEMKREDNINRFIIPIEIKMDKIKDKIRNLK